MIEFVDFGAGFRIDGPDWGASTRPYLEHSWRPLSPEVHDLQAEQTGFAYLHRISVLHDGRGVLTAVPRPEFGRIMGFSPNVASNLGRIIDGTYNFLALTNTKYSEVVGIDPAIAHYAVRVTGMVRYNPGEY